MGKQLKKVLSVVLTLACMLSALPVSALADSSFSEDNQEAAAEAVEAAEIDEAAAIDEEVENVEAVENIEAVENAETVDDSEDIDNAPISEYAAVNEETGEDAQILPLDGEEITAFAILDSEGTLVFYADTEVPDTGSTYDGHTVSKLYLGFVNNDYTNASSAIPWRSDRSNITAVETDPSFADITLISTANWFMDFTNCTSMDLTYLNTSQVTTTNRMFDNCTSLESLDLSSFDTSNVTNMTYMFAYSSGLREINVSSFNTSAVQDMSYMFWQCSALENLDVSEFDTSAVTTMAGMFFQCQSLNELNVAGFQTSNVTTFNNMFYCCKNLTQLDVSGFDTSHATDMQYMFSNCEELSALDLSSFDTSKVTNMFNMFYACKSLTQLDVSGFDTANVTDMEQMFFSCDNLQTIYSDDSNFVTTQVEKGDGVFKNCKSLVGGNGTAFDSDNVTYEMAHVDREENPGYFTNVTQAFAVYATDSSLTFYTGEEIPAVRSSFNGKTVSAVYTGIDTAIYSSSDDVPWENSAQGIKTVTFDESFAAVQPVSTAYWFYSFLSCTAFNHLEYLDTSNVRDMSYMFYGCNNGSLKSLDVSNFNTANVTNMSNMFYNCRYVTELAISNFDTANVTDMSYMFYYCNGVDSLDLSSFDTSNVTDMNNMFYYCSHITDFDLGNFDTSQVVSMASMFRHCSGLTSFDINYFDTSAVTDMSDMFRDCTVLTALNMSDLDTGNVTTMREMFRECNVLEDLDVSGWDTSKVEDFGYMFDDCKALENVDVSHFDTSSATDLQYMFYYCSALTELDFSSWDTQNVTNMSDMFYQDTKLTTIYSDDAMFVTTNVTSSGSMFLGCTSLVGGNGTAYSSSAINCSMAHVDTEENPGYFTEVPGEKEAFAVYSADDESLTFYYASVPSEGRSYHNKTVTQVYTGFDDQLYSAYSSVPWHDVGSDVLSVSFDSSFATVQPVAGAYWFYNFRNCVSLDFTYLDTSCMTSMRAMFRGCQEAEELDLSGFATSNVTTFAQMFYNCNSLSSLDLSNFDTANAENLSEMFYECASLTELAIDGWNTENVTDMNSLFENCSLLTAIDVSDLDTENVTNMVSMFSNCSRLTSLDITNFDTGKVKNMGSMFSNCSRLTQLDVSGFDTANVTSFENMFYGCSRLKELDVSGFDTANVTTMNNMFHNCESLTTLNVSGWDTANVTNMTNLFYGCADLNTIYSDDDNFVTTNVTAGSNVFTDCDHLVGGNGTVYDSAQVTEEMAHVDTDWNPGYFTNIHPEVATVNGVGYLTLAEAVEAAEDGDTVELVNNCRVDAQIVVDKTLTIHLNDFTVYNMEDLWTDDGEWSLISVQGGALTIVGDGTVAAKENDVYAMDVREGGSLVINGGTYVGNVTCIYVYQGTLEINDGEFSIQKTANVARKEYEFTIDCEDSYYHDGTASVVVNGGSFYKFNPADCQAEGNRTDFAAEGLHGHELEEDWYTVEEADWILDEDASYPASCEEDGENVYYCSKCDATCTEILKALGHDYQLTETIEPTCVDEGEEIYECSRCDASYTEPLKALGHESVTDPAVAATCTKDGLTEGSHCDRCGKVLKAQEVVPAKGHSYVWIIDQQADYGIQGKEHQECKVCGARGETKTIAAKATGILLPRITHSTNKTQTVQWNGIKGATKYRLYGAKCSDSGFTLLKNTRSTSVKIRELEKGSFYKFYVVAYNGNTKIATSYKIHSVTEGNEQYGNPTKVTLKQASADLAVGETFKIKATVNSDKKVRKHVSAVRYRSNKTSVCTVNKNGKIKAVGKGTCKVYAIAQNGKRKAVKVTVE